MMNNKAIEEHATQLVAQYDVRTPSVYTKGGSLSGGNQQKLVVAREFSRPIKLLIAAQPTRGLDVGSIEFIHRRIIEQRDAGAAVLLVSAELDEVMSVSDRIAVMYRGKIIATVDAKAATREQLGLLMAGVAPEQVAQQLSESPPSDPSLQQTRNRVSGLSNETRRVSDSPRCVSAGRQRLSAVHKVLLDRHSRSASLMRAARPRWGLGTAWRESSGCPTRPARIFATLRPQCGGQGDSARALHPLLLRCASGTSCVQCGVTVEPRCFRETYLTVLRGVPAGNAAAG